MPTPLTEHGEPDLTYLVGAASALSRVLHEGRLVVVESTTYPGTTRERVGPILEESGLGAADLACIVTAHPEVDYEGVVATAPLVLDLRGVTRGIAAPHLVRL